MQIVKRPLVATILAAEARQKNPAMRMADIMAYAAGQDLNAWLMEASGDVSAEYGEFLVEVQTGLSLLESMETLEPGVPPPEYSGDRATCRVVLLRPLPLTDGSEPATEIVLRRLTRLHIIQELGPQTWTEPSTAKSLRLLSIASGVDADDLKALDFGDYLRLQAALSDFT